MTENLVPLSAMIQPKLKAALEEAANKMEVSTSAIVRQALKKYLLENNKPEKGRKK